jgi:hypothetical protein
MSKIVVLHDKEPTRCMVGTINLNQDGQFPVFAADYRQSANQESARKLLRFLSGQRFIILRIFSSTYHVFVDEDVAVPVAIDGKLCAINWHLNYQPNEPDHIAFFKALLEHGSWVLCVVTQDKVLRTVIGPRCQIITSSVVDATLENTEIFNRIST